MSSTDLLKEKFFEIVSSSSSSLDKLQQFCYSHSDKININERNENSKLRTAVMMASLRQDLGMVEYLVSAQGADVNTQDSQNFTALHFCSGSFSSSTSYSDQRNYFDSSSSSSSSILLYLNYFLICFGKNTKIDARTWDNYTPLALACFCGNVDVAKMLIALGADLEVRCGKNDKTLLEIAEQEHPENAEICQFLRQGYDDDFDGGEFSPSPRRNNNNNNANNNSSSSIGNYSYSISRGLNSSSSSPQHMKNDHRPSSYYGSPAAKRIASQFCEPINDGSTNEEFPAESMYAHMSVYGDNSANTIQNKKQQLPPKILRKIKQVSLDWFENWKMNQEYDFLEQMEKRQEIYLEERIRSERRNLQMISILSQNSSRNTSRSPSAVTMKKFQNTSSLSVSFLDENNNSNDISEIPKISINGETSSSSIPLVGEELLKKKKILSAFRSVLNIFLVPCDDEDEGNEIRKKMKPVQSSGTLFVSKGNAVAAVLTFLPKISPKTIVLNHIERKSNGRSMLRAEEVEEVVDVLTS